MIEGPELVRDTALKYVDAMHDQGYNVALLVFVNAAGEVIQTTLNGTDVDAMLRFLLEAQRERLPDLLGPEQ